MNLNNISNPKVGRENVQIGGTPTEGVWWAPPVEMSSPDCDNCLLVMPLDGERVQLTFSTDDSGTVIEGSVHELNAFWASSLQIGEVAP
jgi:hypothetical protein